MATFMPIVLITSFLLLMHARVAERDLRNRKAWDKVVVPPGSPKYTPPGCLYTPAHISRMLFWVYFTCGIGCLCAAGQFYWVAP